MLRPLLSWIVGFGRFWYHFIVGDDWTLALAVVVALTLTGILNANRVPAWWLVPIFVVAMVGVSLRRAARQARRPPSARAAARV